MISQWHIRRACQIIYWTGNRWRVGVLLPARHLVSLFVCSVAPFSFSTDSHWLSLSLSLSYAEQGWKTIILIMRGFLFFVLEKRKEEEENTLPSRVTSVFLGLRAMNHSCNVSWQFWSEADWAGEFQNKQKKKKKRLQQLPQTHMATRRAWQHLSVCWQSRNVATSFLVPSMSNTETDSTLWKIFP